MDIERLTKSQIVLLTLLVSFVTSIATGIVTVTLIDQAPPAITQTVNRVVERTVEKVVPDKGGNQSAAAAAAAPTTVTTEKTIVVKEEDLITDSIEKNSKRIVRINAPSGGDAPGAFLGLGAVVERDGLIATDATLVSAGVTYTVTTADGEKLEATLVQKSSDNPVALLEARLGDDATPLSPIAPASVDSLKLGQTVLSLGGRERVNVDMGIISSIAVEEGEQPTLSGIETTIDNRALLSGSIVVNIFGEVVGITTRAARAAGADAYTPVTDIQAAVSSYASSLKEDASETAATTS